MENKLTIFGYEEITQSEYRELKSKDPANYHKYTARIKHQYYKLKPQEIIIEDRYCDLTIKISSTGWTTIEQDGNEPISLGIYPNTRFELIEEMLKRVK